MNLPFVRFQTVFKMVVIITEGTLELILVVIFHVQPKIFFLYLRSYIFLQFF